MRSLSSAFLPPPSFPLSAFAVSLVPYYYLSSSPPYARSRVSRQASMSFSALSLSRPRETPRCISSIFKRHGPSARVAQPLYIKRQGACFSRPPFSRAVRGAEVSIEHRVYARGSVTESISCRRAAFYLRYPSPSSVLCPPPSALCLPLARVLSLSALSPSPCPSPCFPLSPPRSTFSVLFASSSSSPVALLHPRDTSDGRWLQSCMLLSLKVTRSSLDLDAISLRLNLIEKLYFCNT